MNYYIAVLKKYAIFTGRAGRAEYWYFFLFNILIIIGLMIIEILLGFNSNSGSGLMVNLYQLAVIIPSIAVGIRRMHDVNKSGWFILIPIYNLVLAVTAGTRGDNKYGPEPKAAEAK